MATRFISLLSSLLFLLYSGISFAKPTPSFPSSIIRPEKISLSTPTEPYREKFFTQVLDHYTFRPQSYKTFQQRYLISEKYWGGAEKNAPIFLYTGNEGDIDWFAQNTGFIVDIAPHFKALLVFIEVIIYLISLKVNEGFTWTHTHTHIFIHFMAYLEGFFWLLRSRSKSVRKV